MKERSAVFAVIALVGGLSMAMLDSSTVLSHGDVAPQAVDTSALPSLGDDWLEENPWRDPEGEHWQTAIAVGASGYNQNCARCHGLEAVSGGLSPDLRFLSADYDGDEWYVERYRNGMTQNGITKMPAFGELLGQEAAWAIRTYIETRPNDGAFDTLQDRLAEIRDTLKARASEAAGDAHAEGLSDEIGAIRSELAEINAQAETGSGAPLVDSAAARAADALDGSPGSFQRASEILSIGLSAAR